jgi:ribosomal protein S18 acetylase RimI-like enzyme
VGGPADLIDVRPLEPFDRALVIERWGEAVVRRGESIPIDGLPGFVAWIGDERAGIVTYAVRGDECEVVTLHAYQPRRGVGSALMDAARDAAAAAGCRRLWLITTNDNLDALRFYQRRGFRLAELRPGAVDRSRLEKPQIPRTGDYGIPLHDEIDLTLQV